VQQRRVTGTRYQVYLATPPAKMSDLTREPNPFRLLDESIYTPRHPFMQHTLRGSVSLVLLLLLHPFWYLPLSTHRLRSRTTRFKFLQIFVRKYSVRVMRFACAFVRHRATRRVEFSGRTDAADTNFGKRSYNFTRIAWWMCEILKLSGTRALTRRISIPSVIYNRAGAYYYIQ